MVPRLLAGGRLDFWPNVEVANRRAASEVGEPSGRDRCPERDSLSRAGDHPSDVG
jgi:hypothetical protein